MATDKQRPPQIGDWTVCQDKDTTKTAIRPQAIDSINQLNVLDWAIADYKNGKEQPYLYVPNRVYPLDTVILKPTLEGLMPIPENLDGNCYFETERKESIILERKPANYSCVIGCKVRDGQCPPYTQKRESSGCPLRRSGGQVDLVAIGVWGYAAVIDFRIRASSAFEYLDIRITDWPRQTTWVNGIGFDEDDAMGWVPGQNIGVDFRYDSLGNNVFRIWALPGPCDDNTGRFGPAGTDVKIRVRFTLIGEYTYQNQYVWYGTFPETTRTVEVSYVGAGRRGNHR